jgi:hypothetical protein
VLSDMLHWRLTESGLLRRRRLNGIRPGLDWGLAVRYLPGVHHWLHGRRVVDVRTRWLKNRPLLYYLVTVDLLLRRGRLHRRLVVRRVQLKSVLQRRLTVSRGV